MSEIATGQVRANGIDFHFLEQGDGPLMLCLHGFPDHAPTFRHQLAGFAAQGYRVVAPYMRGYAPTGPAPDGVYRTAALAQDALALIDALGGAPAVLIGHDWGATAAYGAALFAPEKVRRLITMAVPYGTGMAKALLTDPDQQRRSWYMGYFQMYFAEAAVAANDFAFIARLWRDWSPGYEMPADDWAALRATFAGDGVVAAALQYYRQTFSGVPAEGELATLQARIGREAIGVPALYLHGADDGCIAPGLEGDMAALFPKGLEKQVVANAGHFLHLEQPETVNRLIGDFIG